MRPLSNRSLASLLALVISTIVLIKTAWLGDDAFITLRTVDNLLSGHGAVWNIAERVQAYTHPLWMLALTGVIGLSGEFFYSTILFSITVSVLAIWIVVRHLATSPMVGLFALSLLVFSKAFTDYSTSGLENPLSHLLLVLFVAVALRAQRSLRSLTWATLICAFAALTRLDLLLIYLPLLGWLFLKSEGSWRSRILALFSGFLPLVAWELFSLIYYGFPFPNTAYAKLNTGLPRSALLQQGIFYIWHSFGTDPITVATILGALGVTGLLRSSRRLALAAGIALYIVYVIVIGGDFMTGRFLSVPFVGATALLASTSWPADSRLLPLIWASAVLLGFANPEQSPILSQRAYSVRAVDSRGIADERGHYYPLYGLLSASRLNRFTEQGIVRGTVNAQPFEHCGIGLRGFSASPYTPIVDLCGLADPLLARIPAAYDLSWRIGHPLRALPPGYMQTVRDGRNQIQDSALAAYYDQLSLVTRGNLWSRQRLGAIWRLNSGQLSHLIDQEQWLYAETPSVRLAELKAIDPSGRISAAAGGWALGRYGVHVRLDGVQNAPHLYMQTDDAYFDVHFLRDGRRVAEITVSESPIQFGERLYRVIDVPQNAITAGYETLRILPRQSSDSTLVDVALWAAPSPTQPIDELLAHYFYTFYRHEDAARDAGLAAVRRALESAAPAAWDDVAVTSIYEMLRMPDPALHPLIYRNAPHQQQLNTAEGAPRLLYFGHVANQTAEDERFQGIRFELHFEVLESFAEPYTIWFHIAATESAQELIIYDYAPMDDIRQWPLHSPLIFSPLLRLAPGEYEISFGLWTPQTRKRLYSGDPAQDIHWINLGTHGVSDP